MFSRFRYFLFSNSFLHGRWRSCLWWYQRFLSVQCSKGYSYSTADVQTWMQQSKSRMQNMIMRVIYDKDDVCEHKEAYLIGLHRVFFDLELYSIQHTTAKTWLVLIFFVEPQRNMQTSFWSQWPTCSRYFAGKLGKKRETETLANNDIYIVHYDTGNVHGFYHLRNRRSLLHALENKHSHSIWTRHFLFARHFSVSLKVTFSILNLK